MDCLYIAPHNIAKDRPTRQSSTYAQKFAYLVRSPADRCFCRDNGNALDFLAHRQFVERL